RRRGERSTAQGTGATGPQRDRPHRHARPHPVGAGTAQDPQRQDHAPDPAQDRRGCARPAGRYIDAGGPGGGGIAGRQPQGRVMDATDLLEDPGLLRMQCPVGGAWRDADGGGGCEVTNPATGAVLGTVPDMGPAETRAAIEAAHAALPEWSARTAQERARVLRRMHALMLEHQEDLARLMTAEQGKPLAESRGEIAYSAAYLEWFAEEGRRMYGEVIPPHAADRRIVVLRQPVGVAALITPWNFPSAMLGRKLGAALAAGCAVVCKPALQTPFSALALAVIGERAGLPPGVINMVTGSDAAAIGEAMTSH